MIIIAVLVVVRVAEAGVMMAMEAEMECVGESSPPKKTPSPQQALNNTAACNCNLTSDLALGMCNDVALDDFKNATPMPPPGSRTPTMIKHGRNHSGVTNHSPANRPWGTNHQQIAHGPQIAHQQIISGSWVAHQQITPG